MERADLPRPSGPAMSRWFSRAVLVTALLLPLALVGSGVCLLAQVGFGARVRAEVLSCHQDGYPTYARHCVARWSVQGVERIGRISAVDDGDVGRTVSATERDGVLYRASVTLPLLLVGLGVVTSWFPVRWSLRKVARGRAQRRRRGAA